MKIDSQIWTELEAEELSPADIVTRPALPELTLRILAAVDYHRRRHFLLLLEQADVEYDDDGSRGLAVSTRELNRKGLQAGRYLDIECMDTAGHEAFDLIGSELVDILGESKTAPIDAVKQVLAKWRRFWGQTPRTTLSREDLLGLFGEVWFLTNWLIPLVGPKAVISWQGPAGGRHDFQWESGSVEVKTTSSTRGRLYHINGIDQLEPPESGPLYFFSLRVREEIAATNSLPAIIELCEKRLAGEAAELDIFEGKLALAKYSPAHVEDYGSVHLRVVEEALFEVCDDFPRIRPTDFAGGLSAGVEEVSYAINLNTYEHLRIAKIPEEAEVLRW